MKGILFCLAKRIFCHPCRLKWIVSNSKRSAPLARVKTLDCSSGSWTHGFALKSLRKLSAPKAVFGLRNYLFVMRLNKRALYKVSKWFMRHLSFSNLISGMNF